MTPAPHPPSTRAVSAPAQAWPPAAGAGRKAAAPRAGALGAGEGTVDNGAVRSLRLQEPQSLEFPHCRLPPAGTGPIFQEPQFSWREMVEGTHVLSVGCCLLLGCPCFGALASPELQLCMLLSAPPHTVFLELKPVAHARGPLDSGHPPCAGGVSSAPAPSCGVAGLEVCADVLFGSAVASTGFCYWFGLRAPPSTLSWPGC